MTVDEKRVTWFDEADGVWRVDVKVAWTDDETGEVTGGRETHPSTFATAAEAVAALSDSNHPVYIRGDDRPRADEEAGTCG